MPNHRTLWLILFLAGCGGASSTAPPPPPPAPPPPPPGPGGGTPPTASVAMAKSGDGYGGDVHSFNPAGVTVARAGTVTWTNNTGFTHNVTFAGTSGAPANIPNLGDGSVARTFNTAGTFNYQCTNHSGMTGQVIVR